MDARELRPLPLFEGLTDDQLGELAAAGTEVAIEPGEDLFTEGEHADFWWVLVDGALELIRHVGREDTVVGRMDVAGPLGRWVPGVGRRRRLPRDRHAAPSRGACSGSRPPGCASCSTPGSRSAYTSSAGCTGPRAAIESTARQREALVTLGTLAAGFAHEINNPAAATTRAVGVAGGGVRRLAVVAGEPRGRRDLGRPVRGARRPAPRGPAASPESTERARAGGPGGRAVHLDGAAWRR